MSGLTSESIFSELKKLSSFSPLIPLGADGRKGQSWVEGDEREKSFPQESPDQGKCVLYYDAVQDWFLLNPKTCPVGA